MAGTPSSFNVHKLPEPPKDPNTQDAINILLQSAVNFCSRAKSSEVSELNKLYAKEKQFFEKANLVRKQPEICYLTVASYLQERTNPKSAGKRKTYRKKQRSHKTRKHRTM